jgi:hypothetical protein
VVSATDDLHPIPNLIDESNPSKRAVSQAAVPQTPDWSNFGPPPAHLAEISGFRPRSEAVGSVSEYLIVFPEWVLAGTSGCRAPPSA